MSLFSRLGTQLGFQLGGSLSPVNPSLSGVAKAIGYVSAVGLSVTASGFVVTAGYALATYPVEPSRLGARLGFQLGGNLTPLQAAPGSIAGVAQALGSVSAHVSVSAFGTVKTSGSCTVKLSVTALGITQATTALFNTSVTSVGATSVVTTSGSCKANVAVTGLGVTTTQGYIKVAVLNVSATAIGRATAQGYCNQHSLSVYAQGLTTTLGSCTPNKPFGSLKCVIGSTPPSTPKPSNYAL